MTGIAPRAYACANVHCARSLNCAHVLRVCNAARVLLYVQHSGSWMAMASSLSDDDFQPSVKRFKADKSVTCGIAMSITI